MHQTQRFTIRARGLVTCLAVLASCQPLLAGGDAASFNAKPLDPWTSSCVADMYYFVPTRAGTSLPYLVFTNSCRSSHGCEAVLQYGGDGEAYFIPFDWSIYYDTGGGYVVERQINLPTANPQYLTQRPDQFGVVRQMLRVRNGTYYLGPADGKYKFRNQIDLFDFVRGDWDAYYSREFYAQSEAQAASWRGLSDALAWMPMVETFGYYANLMTEVLGCDLARFFYDGECMWQTPDNTSATLAPVGQSRWLGTNPDTGVDDWWLTLSYAPNTHFAVCMTTSGHQPTVAPPMGSLCVTANTNAGGFTLSTASGTIDPYWVSTPDGQWWDKTVGQLPPGYYRITFSPVAGVTTPPEQIFQITENNVTTVEAVYGGTAANTPVVALTSPLDRQTLWGASLAATAVVAAGTPPYTVTYYTKPAVGGAYTAAGAATVAPYSVSLSALPIGAYMIYASVTDSSPVPVMSTSAVATFIVAPTATWANTADSGNWSNPLSWDTGAVPVSGATVVFGTAGSTAVLDAANRTVSSLLFNRAANFTLNNSGSYGLTVNNYITSSNQYTNTINAPVTLGAANIWTVNDGSTLQVNGAVGGNALLTKAGSGTLTLTANNSITGGVTLKAGTLLLGSGNALGSGALTIHGGSINGTSGSLTMPHNNPIVMNGNFTWTGGGGYNWNMGAGAVTLNSNLSVYVGNTLTIGGAISGPGGLNALDIAFKNMVGATYGVQLLAPITLRDNQTITGSGETINGVIGDGGHGYGLNVAVSDVWGGWGGKLTFNAANTYSGDTTISTGLLGVGHNLALQYSALNTAAGIARLSVTSPTVGGLKGSTDLASVFTEGYGSVSTLILNPQGGTSTYSGAIADGASGMTLTKSGNGTQVLSGPITYTGATNINAGTLVLDGANTGGGAVTVKSGARLGGNGSTPSAVTVQSGGKWLANVSDWDLGTCSNLTVGTLSLPATWTLNVTATGFTETDRTFTFLTTTGGVSGFTAPTVSGPGAGTWMVRMSLSDAKILELVYTAISGTPTTLVLDSSLNPSAPGQGVTFTATVKNGGVTTTDATGTCTFRVDGTVMATVPIANGAAGYSTIGLTSGARAILASYSGDAGYASSSASLTQVCGNPIVPTYTTRGDGKTVATFTSGSGLWTVPGGVTSVEVLVVGGGGSGSYWGYQNVWPNPSYGGGGGGGGFYYTNAYPVTGGGSVEISVGAGGAAGNTGNPGGSSGFDALIAFGGANGPPGSGGASGANNQGGAGYAGGEQSGGGGGAGQAGQGPWFAAPNNDGGNGLACSITGTSRYYGGGGSSFYNGAQGGLGGGGSTLDDNQSPHVADPNGDDGLGGGGAAGRNALSEVGKGGTGVVIAAYQVVPPYDTWKAGTFTNAFTDTDPAHDPDHDGRTNQQEFAFGLDPTSGASNNPVTVLPDKTTHKFRYTRWAASGLTYTVETSTTLLSWAGPAAATQTVVSASGGVETVEVTLTAPPSGGTVFVRIKAQ